MKPLLIFDYDGTIHNTMKIYSSAFHEAYSWLISQNLMKREDISEDRISGWLGYNSIDMWNDFAPALDDKYKKKASEIVTESMRKAIFEGKAEWFSGAEETLDRLKSEGYRMVVLSNCKKGYRDAHFEVFDMGRWFEEFYDCESRGFIPKKNIVEEILEKYPGEYIVIGDRKSDMECTWMGGAFIGCLYGYGKEGELEGADAFVENVGEIADVVINMTEKHLTTMMGNPRKPEGKAGERMLERMNDSHYEVTGWGLSFVPIGENDSVLDIGCGGGMTLKRISEKTCGKLCGIDYSPESVKKSREKVGNRAEISYGSVSDMPYDDDSFDRIVTVESFYFWPDHKNDLKEVRRVLKPGGVFQIIADVYDNGMLDEKTLAHVKECGLFNPTEGEFEELFEKAGFVEIKVHTKEDSTWICVEGKK